MEQISIDKIKEILLERDDIEDILCFTNEELFSKKYNFILECKLLIFNKAIPILIAIPNNWSIELFDFFILKYGYNKSYGNISNKLGYDDCECFRDFIPHVEPFNGKICLYELEGVLIDPCILGLLNQCIEKAKNIIKNGILKTDLDSFIKEFDSYWNSSQNIIEVNLCRPKNDVCVLKYTKSNIYESFVAAEETSAIDFWTKIQTLHNAFYFKIQPDKPIYPPDMRNPLSRNFLNSLLKYVTHKQYKKVKNKITFPSMLFFDFENPLPTSSSSVRICVGISILKGDLIEENGIIECTDDTYISPIAVYPIDKDFLMQRTHSTENALRTKRYLVIGCGSIGGYLCDLLAKSGCENITLVDYDKLTEINIFRHLLGGFYNNLLKTEAIKLHISKNIPNANIITINQKIQNAVNNQINLHNYDYIFSVTGNHNVNRWLEEYIDKQNIKTKIIYGWNEPLDIGCHAAFVDTQKTGRFSSIFVKDSKNNCLFDKTAYTAPNQKVTIDNTGCGGSFIPYGSEVSIKTAIQCVNLLKRDIENLLDNNIIISEKGTGFYFTKAGLKLSKTYDNQDELIKEIDL